MAFLVGLVTVVRKSISDKIYDLELMSQLTKSSQFTRTDVDAISSKINKDVFKALNKR